MPATLQEIADRIIAWATEETGVRAVILEGSMARAHDTTTPWSDLDVNLKATPVLPSERIPLAQNLG